MYVCIMCVCALAEHVCFTENHMVDGISCFWHEILKLVFWNSNTSWIAFYPISIAFVIRCNQLFADDF